MTPAIKDRFVHPTAVRAKSGKVETIIGRRNLLTTSEAVMSGLCANPEVMKLDGDCWPNAEKLAVYAVDIAKELLEEVERNEA